MSILSILRTGLVAALALAAVSGGCSHRVEEPTELMRVAVGGNA